MSRLRRPFPYDRYILVTADLLRWRAKLGERDYRGWRSPWRASGQCGEGELDDRDQSGRQEKGELWQQRFFDLRHGILSR